VNIHHALPEPKLVHAEGGALLAHLGFGSDDAVAELDALGKHVAEALARPPHRVVLSEQCGDLSDLFAPSNPRVSERAGELVWVLNVGILDVWACRLEQLVDRLRAFTSARPALSQCAYLAEGGSPFARSLTPLLEAAGIPPRIPERDGSLLVEVHRPEGVVITALLGMSWTDAIQPGGDARSPRPLLRAPRLRRLLLEASSGPTPWRGLMEELLRREAPFLFIANPAGGVAQQQWPGSEPALPAYPDERSFAWTVEDLRLESVRMAVMPPHVLFSWAAGKRSAVALNVYKDRASPSYVMLGAEDVQALARGTIPPRK
jgi:hypothetical protein